VDELSCVLSSMRTTARGMNNVTARQAADKAVNELEQFINVLSAGGAAASAAPTPSCSDAGGAGPSGHVAAPAKRVRRR
jgi:Tfp pilus assembly protein PilX